MPCPAEFTLKLCFMLQTEPPGNLGRFIETSKSVPSLIKTMMLPNLLWALR